MAAVWMKIDKFGDAPVLIDSGHPLAVAQRQKESAGRADTQRASAPAAPSPLASVARLDGKPLERGPDGLVHGETLNLTDEERSALPKLGVADPSAPNVTGTARRSRKRS